MVSGSWLARCTGAARVRYRPWQPTTALLGFVTDPGKGLLGSYEPTRDTRGKTQHANFAQSSHLREMREESPNLEKFRCNWGAPKFRKEMREILA